MMACMLRRYAGLREEFSFGRLDVTNAEGGGVIVGGEKRPKEKAADRAQLLWFLMC